MQKKLLRNRSNRMIGGVCGGLGPWLGIDPTLIRIFFVLLALGEGIGLFVYLLLWIIIPQDEDNEFASRDTVHDNTVEIGQRAREMGADFRQELSHPSAQTGLILGIGLVVIGIIYLINQLNIPWLRWLDFSLLLPVLLIIAGITLIWRRFKGG